MPSVRCSLISHPASGDWAGSQGVWDNGCSDVAPTCVEYVQQAASWTSAVFEVAYVRVSGSLRSIFAELLNGAFLQVYEV